ncbi:MAG: DUF2807 domain-containing protein [Spirochaetaceae bacterium]|nr:DUF2807 domain-containing protein [Spirochaetaceae bacterium]
MKKLGILAIFISLLFTSCLRGNGIIIAEERAVTAFEAIRINGSSRVQFHHSPNYRVVVKADSNLIDNVETIIRGNTLEIGTKSGLYWFTELLIEVYAPTLSGVTISGSGRFNSDDTIQANNFTATISGSGRMAVLSNSSNINITISGSGRLNGNFTGENLTAAISGSGRMTILGNSHNANITISGSGRFSGESFTINNSVITLRGSGRAAVYVANSLNATVSGSGRIEYSGNPPSVTTNISGSGRVTAASH